MKTPRRFRLVCAVAVAVSSCSSDTSTGPAQSSLLGSSADARVVIELDPFDPVPRPGTLQVKAPGTVEFEFQTRGWPCDVRFSNPRLSPGNIERVSTGAKVRRTFMQTGKVYYSIHCSNGTFRTYPGSGSVDVW